MQFCHYNGRSALSSALTFPSANSIMFTFVASSFGAYTSSFSVGGVTTTNDAPSCNLLMRRRRWTMTKTTILRMTASPPMTPPMMAPIEGLLDSSSGADAASWVLVSIGVASGVSVDDSAADVGELVVVVSCFESDTQSRRPLTGEIWRLFFLQPFNSVFCTAEQPELIPTAIVIVRRAPASDTRGERSHQGAFAVGQLPAKTKLEDVHRVRGATGFAGVSAQVVFAVVVASDALVGIVPISGNR